MKKIISFAFILFILFNFKVYAIDFQVFDMRNKIFEESKELKALLPNSKDVILLTTMFDSCIIATSQLDAYFYMLGIFGSIKRENLTNTAIDSITTWLTEIKKTTELSINILNIILPPIEKTTQARIKKLQSLFAELNNRINAESNKFYLIKKSLKPIRR